MKQRSATLMSTSSSCMATVAEGVIDPMPLPTLYTLTCACSNVLMHRCLSYGRATNYCSRRAYSLRAGVVFIGHLGTAIIFAVLQALKVLGYIAEKGVALDGGCDIAECPMRAKSHFQTKRGLAYFGVPLYVPFRLQN